MASLVGLLCNLGWYGHRTLMASLPVQLALLFRDGKALTSDWEGNMSTAGRQISATHSFSMAERSIRPRIVISFRFRWRITTKHTNEGSMSQKFLICYAIFFAITL